MAKDTSMFPGDDEPEGCRGIDAELFMTLSSAYAMTKESGHDAVALEHVLFYLTFNGSAIPVFEEASVDLEEIRLLMRAHLETKLKSQVTDPPWSASLLMGLNRLAVIAMNLPSRRASGLHMLHQITEFEESYAGTLLRRKGITRISMQKFLR